MLIDWFTVGAQVLNFLILVWLMKRFLYKPILNAIDAREKRIAAAIADADAKSAEAQAERDTFRDKNETFDRERAERMNRATEAAQAERQRLIEEARRSADALSAKRRDDLRREQEGLRDALTRRTQQEVFAIARKTLKELAGTTLEAGMSDAFTRRLRALEGDAKNRFAKALAGSTEPARVRSAFDLPVEARTAIEAAVRATFASDAAIRFETEPDVIGGIELTVNGQKVAWSIADYLASLETNVGELLNERAQPEAKQP